VQVRCARGFDIDPRWKDREQSFVPVERRAAREAARKRPAERGRSMAPKKSWASERRSRLNPTASIERREFVLVFRQVAAVRRSALGEPDASLAARHVDLIAALDVLFTGV
jgi:hypothetical protein